MYQSQAIHRPHISDHGGVLTIAFNAGRSAARLKAIVVNAFGAWQERSVRQSRLYRLNGHVLRDIGITRHDIGHGPTESFWRD